MRGVKIAITVCVCIFFCPSLYAEGLLIDDFEKEKIVNLLGNRTNVYVKPPSRIMMSFEEDERGSSQTKVLALKYSKENEGGPYGKGGWCGYYTLLKQNGAYFDASKYKKLTFLVRGENGSECFMVGLSDRHWDKIGDSLKSEKIDEYLPKRKITTQWQKAAIPLDIYLLDLTNLAAVSINFEGECFLQGKGSGVVYIDDLKLE